MGQGTDSCGGYDAYDDYEEYMDGLTTGHWTQRDGTQIHISKMSSRHLKNAERLVRQKADRMTFSSDAEIFQQWSEIFDNELSCRPCDNKASALQKNRLGKKPPRSIKGRPEILGSGRVIMKCHCGNSYQAKKADLRRGWGLSCSKRCAAIRREYGRPCAEIDEQSEIIERG